MLDVKKSINSAEGRGLSTDGVPAVDFAPFDGEMPSLHADSGDGRGLRTDVYLD